MIDIMGYIPQGHDNAVTYEQLISRTGLTQREVREVISAARAEHCIINLQDGKGFFTPLENEKELVKRYLKQEYSRYLNLQISFNGAEKWLREAETAVS